MKNINERKIFAISFLIMAIAFAYYFAIYIPKKDTNARLSQEQIQSEKNDAQLRMQIDEDLRRDKQKNDLKDCLTQSDTRATAYWNKQCQDFGVDKDGREYLKDDCNLNKYHADSVNKYRTEQRDICFKMFPQN